MAFAYTPKQATAAAVAGLSCAGALAGLAVTTFTDGPLAAVGGWAAAALLVLTPLTHFVKAAAPLIEDALDGDGEVQAG